MLDISHGWENNHEWLWEDPEMFSCCAWLALLVPILPILIFKWVKKDKFSVQRMNCGNFVFGLFGSIIMISIFTYILAGFVFGAMLILGSIFGI
jgi:hypothetical protein